MRTGIGKKGKIMMGFLLVGMISAAAVSASFTDEIGVTNHIAVGDVNISIAEYARKGTGEVKYKEPAEVVPGQTISKIPRIKNDALPCWIRARITYAGEKDQLECLNEENIGGISKEWVKRGEYYYYTKVLKKQETTDLFQTVSIPDTWTEEHSGQKLNVDIQADAIQAANFKPDFSAMSPWGNQVIEQCIHEQNGTLTCRKGETKLSVEFSGKAHKLIAVPDDFFTNLESAMPGDVLKDSVTIANTTAGNAEIFFRTDTEGRSEEQLKMLQDIPFEIRQNNKILYKGTLDAAELAKARSLGNFKSGQKGSLEFMLTIPKEWDNAYALKKTDVTWIFAVSEEEKETPDLSKDKDDSSTYGKAAKAKDTQAQRKHPVKTGDDSEPLPLFLLLLGSGTIVLTIQIFKGGKRNMKKRLAGILLASLMMVSTIPGVQAAGVQEWKTESAENSTDIAADMQESDLSENDREDSEDEADISFDEETAEPTEDEKNLESSENENESDEILLEEDAEEDAAENDETAEDEELFADEEELISTYGASSIPVDWVDADYKMPEEYAFTYAFREGVTELTYISRTNSTLNNKLHNWFGDGLGYTVDYCQTFYAAAIDDKTYTEPITAVYSNVGEYQGQIVDLRVTVPQWGTVNKNHVGKDGKKITPCVMFYKNRIAFNTIAVGIVRFKFEFLRHNTDEQIYPKGHVTAADLDGGQGIRVYDTWGVDHIYLRRGYDYLKVETGTTANGSPYREIRSSEGSGSLGNDDVEGWCHLDFNGSFLINWLSQDSWKNSTGVQNAFYISTGQTVGTYEPNPGPEKRVGDELEHFESMNRHEFTQDDPPYETTPEGYFDYVISQRLLPGTYESFVLTDELDPCLKFVYANVETSLGNIVTEHFDIEENDGTIVFRAKRDFLKTDEAYNDVTYHFRIRVQAGTMQEINEHGHYREENQFFAISNKASRTIVSDRMNDSQDTNESWVMGRATFDDGEIIVTKKIKEADITWAHGNPVFRFQITGKDQQGISHVYEDYVEFKPGMYEASGEDAVLSCVFKGIQAGRYTISELPTLRYRFESITADTENVSISEKTGIASIDMNQKKAAVTFRNKKTRYDRYSHTDVVRNTIPLAS